MKGQTLENGQDIRCPRCDGNVLYRYGTTVRNRRRYLCLACNRQFTLGSTRTEEGDRPVCPSCRNTMHIYKRESNSMRYRCSRYPECDTYVKIKTETTPHDILLP
jgi:DNA-directed RNA polymerase subunit RPC12/RpoP